MAILQNQVEKAGTQVAFAEEVGISSAYLSDVLRGHRNVGNRILEALGYERIEFYRKKR